MLSTVRSDIKPAAAGRTESDVMPLADTLAVQELMAEVLRQMPGGSR